MLSLLALATEDAVKIPMPPPRFDALFAGIQKDPARFVHVFTSGLLTETTASPYLPWDKVRYKRPPLDLTHEEWWLVTKLGRQSLQRSLPLLDKDGRSF